MHGRKPGSAWVDEPGKWVAATTREGGLDAPCKATTKIGFYI